MINKLVKENFYKAFINAKCRESQETRHVKINLLLCDAIWINLCIKFRLHVGGMMGGLQRWYCSLVASQRATNKITEGACDSSISRRCRKKFAFKIKGDDTSTESARKLLALSKFLKTISLVLSWLLRQIVPSILSRLLCFHGEEKTFSTMKASL